MFRIASHRLLDSDVHRFANGDLYSKLCIEGREELPRNEKSYTAGKILDDLRASQTDGISGVYKPKEFFLFERASDSVGKTSTTSMYSSLLGRTVVKPEFG